MSSDDQETATVHDTKREKMTASTASSRSEVLILEVLRRRMGNFQKHVLTLTSVARKLLKIEI